MMQKGWMTVLILGGAIVLVLGMLFREAFSGPTFRAEDHASYTECIRNIPSEWLPGSLERTRSETACAYVHDHPSVAR